MRTVFFSAILLLSSALLPGQDATFTSPQGGYVFDRYVHAIRPVMGIPGAAYLGAGIGDQLDSAWPAPGYPMAIAVRQGQTVLFKNLTSQPASMDAPSALLAAPTVVAWSSNGSFAVLYSSSVHQLERIGFSQGGVTIDTPIDAGQFGSEVMAIAVDNQGSIIVAASRPDHPRVHRARGTLIYRVQADGTPTRVASTGGRVILLAAGAGAYYVDLEEGILYAVPQAGTGASSRPLSNGWQTADGLAASADGRNLYIAAGKGRKVSVYDLNTNSITAEIPVSQAVTGLRPLTSSTFVLGGFTSATEPLYVLDAHTSPPTVYFVPTAVSSSL